MCRSKRSIKWKVECWKETWVYNSTASLSLCNYSEAYILLELTITGVGGNPNTIAFFIILPLS